MIHENSNIEGTVNSMMASRTAHISYAIIKLAVGGGLKHEGSKYIRK